MNELALFAGAGGGILGGHLIGWRTVCAVEWEPYAASVLAARQNDGLLPPFPIWDDVQTFDGRPWRGRVDVVSGGFPCQDISVAGKGAGIDGERSGMWAHMARIVCEVRPRYVFVENSPMLTSRGLGRVLGDLAAMGFDAEWGVVSAADTGAPHLRERIWIVAHADSKFGHEWRPSDAIQGQGRRDADRGAKCSHNVANSNGQRQQEQHPATEPDQARQHPRSHASGWGGTWWSTEPDVGRVADGVAARVDRLKALANGQVSRVAAAAFAELFQPTTTSPANDNQPATD